MGEHPTRKGVIHMRSIGRTVGATIVAFTGLLALLLALVVPPAGAHETSHHPSGNDRVDESGGSSAEIDATAQGGSSGVQGNSESEPDENGSGPERDSDTGDGLDKIEGTGGDHPGDIDDQDDNNGCGNDQDFEDDNEGLCLRQEGAPGRQAEEAAVAAEEEEEEAAEEEQAEEETAAAVDVAMVQRQPEVLGEILERGPAGVTAQPAPQVLAETAERQPQPAAAASSRQLAATGMGGWLVLAAALAILLGITLVRLRDRLSTRRA
jgi:hypothetical protein